VRTHGHAWTIGTHLSNVARPPRAPQSRPWSIVVDDALHGAVRLSGHLTEKAGSRTLLIVVHGLGGSADSPYARRAASAALAHGVSSLRFHLRGADRSGEDFYHAALTADLAAALRSPDLARYERVGVLGYSLGGHIALRSGVELVDPRVRAVAAVCAPLDLASVQAWLDRPVGWIYRQYMLSALKVAYGAVASRQRAVPLDLREARRIRTIRDWDERIVAPRHGFRDADHYYNHASVAPLLPALEIPALLVLAEHDPMVPAHTVRPALARASDALDVRWLARGGHIGFPRDVDLGVDAARGLDAQVVAWLARATHR